MGFVTYSNAAKAQLLGVHEATLAFYGAVSEEAGRGEMAIGARFLAAKADYALSISGIAGPGGGSEEKPGGHGVVRLGRQAAYLGATGAFWLAAAAKCARRLCSLRWRFCWKKVQEVAAA